MPLYKRRPFSLLEPPKDLDAHESVYQIRFTKELFKEYEEYLKRLNLYRQRLWTCKVTGKSNMTYEEALVSEHHATEKVQQFPKDLVAPVLRMIQFSTANLKDLVDEMYHKLEESLFEGLELQGRKDEALHSCKILKILDDGDVLQYEVGWMDRDKKIGDTSIVKAEDLVHKKRPFSRRVLREFIRESTHQAAPWVVHEKLALKHGIATEPPEELRNQFMFVNGSTWIIKKIKANGDISDSENSRINKKRKVIGNGNIEDQDLFMKAGKRGYPIDDLLVCPAANDPIFTERPPLSLQFNVPMDCVGDLLMVWEFVCTFGKLLHLWPFALEDLENAIGHKDSNLILIMELHSALLNLLINDEGEYLLVTKNKKRKSKIKPNNWTEFLCDFLEMEDEERFSDCVGTIKRGHYGLLEAHMKLCILHDLISEVLETITFRHKLDERFEQQQALAATKRDEARRKKLKMETPDKKETNHVDIMENGDRSNQTSALNETHIDRVDEVHLPDKAGKREQNCQPSILMVEEKKPSVENGCDMKSMKDQRRGKDMDKETEEKKPEIVVYQRRGKDKDIERDMDMDKDKDEETQEKKPEITTEHLDREIEKLSVRTNFLGKDRNYNRYWFFRREGRLFVESSDGMQWGYYTTKEELDALVGSLNPKGERERALKRQFERNYNRISLALQKRSKDVAHKVLLEENVLRRSTRVRAQPRDSSSTAFLRYINKWKET